MKIKGFTLPELIITIVVLAILGVTILMPVAGVLRETPRTSQNITALDLAQKRMEFILAQKQIKGFSSFSDLCTGGSPPALCTAPSGYTVSSSISSDFGGDTNFKVITVTVSGKGDAQLVSLVGNY